jgi:hypothetical protein
MIPKQAVESVVVVVVIIFVSKSLIAGSFLSEKLV